MSLCIEKIAQIENKVKKFIAKTVRDRCFLCKMSFAFSRNFGERNRVILRFPAFQSDKDTSLYRTAFFFALTFVKKEKIRTLPVKCGTHSSWK